MFRTTHFREFHALRIMLQFLFWQLLSSRELDNILSALANFHLFSGSEHYAGKVKNQKAKHLAGKAKISEINKLRLKKIIYL